MTDVTLDDPFRRAFKGRIISPGHDEYDAARAVWNGMIDRRPALIAYCTDNDDVIAAVHFARRQRLRVSVRCGGHSVAGKAILDNGLAIDLSAMSKVSVDPDSRTATVQGGARLGEVDAATQAFGLATPAGIVSETGVGGLTLGGGVGYLARRFGLTSDNLLAADVVTAAGELVRGSTSAIRRPAHEFATGPESSGATRSQRSSGCTLEARRAPAPTRTPRSTRTR